MERKKYALAAAYFLLNSLPDNLFRKVRTVVLFGSVATDTASKESDADIFFDVDMKATETAQAKRILRKAVQDFYLSNEALKFRLKGIDNPISLHIGKLDEWKELRESIENTGIALYGRYTPSRKIPKNYVVFHWEGLKIPNRGAFLNKIYGYKVKKKRYLGILERLGGKKIGKSAILIPLQHKSEIMQILEKYKIDYRILEL